MRRGENEPERVRERFLQALDRPFVYEDLFDAITDTVFFVKDVEGRYVAVNRTLATRTRRERKSELIGLTATDVFSGVLGEAIAEQDRTVVNEGRPIHGRLELHLYPGGAEDWCLTWKEPIVGSSGKIIGLSGISRDLKSLAAPPRNMAGVSAVIDHVHRNIDAPLRLPDLAERAGLSVHQLELRIRGLFGLSVRQYLRAGSAISDGRLSGSSA